MYIALYGRKFGAGTQDKLRVLLSSLSEEEIQISCLDEEDRRIFYGALAIFEANLRRISREGIPEKGAKRSAQ